MNRVSLKSINHASSVPATRRITGRRVKTAAVSLLLASGSLIGIAATAAPASATTVPNRMYCEPDTGWCYQVNPPYVPGVIHYCQWDYQLHNLYSGMWYTGCDQWGPDIY